MTIRIFKALELHRAFRQAHSARAGLRCVASCAQVDKMCVCVLKGVVFVAHTKNMYFLMR